MVFLILPTSWTMRVLTMIKWMSCVARQRSLENVNNKSSLIFLNFIYFQEKSSGEFLHFLGNNTAPLLLGHHYLESIEIAQSSSLLLGAQLLCPRRGIPLVLNICLLPCCGKRLLSCIQWNLYGVISKGNTAKRNYLPWNSSKIGRPIDEAFIRVNNVNDGGELSLIRTVVNKDYTSNFNISLENLLRN